MKKLITFFTVLTLLSVAVPAFAAKGGEKGASQTAYDRASEESIFHRVGDWFATIGKSEQEKKAIISERKARRAAERTQNKMKQNNRQMHNEMQKSQKNMNKQSKDMMKGMKQR